MSSSSTERIEQLPDDVISQIAAGEVVERPASVAKELIENALDAGASLVSVDYDDKGSSRVVVSDNGSGIASGEVELALTRHATSKIRDIGDLALVSTLGFRGEALASIAAVSDLEMVTRTSESDSAVRVRVRSGKIVDMREGGHSRGTRVDVQDLFAKVPARKKFLKAPATEFAVLADTLRRFALGYPGVGFELKHNGVTVLAAPAVETRQARLTQVLGADVAGDMIPIQAEHRGLRMSGFVSRAGSSFGSTRYMSSFVNGRWVRDRAIFRCVMQGYRTYLLKGRYPAVALHLEIDPQHVDVNVHPSKHEVRFSDPDLVHHFIIEGVSDCLQSGSSAIGRWGIGTDTLRVREGLNRRSRQPQARAQETGPSAGAGRAGVARSATDRNLPGYTAPAQVAEAGSAMPGEQQDGLQFSAGDAPGRLGRLEVLAQAFNGYIICQADAELVLVDQHAAHERLIFEKLKSRSLEGKVERQQLLVPQAVTVGSGGVAAVEQRRDSLDSLGWEIETFGDSDVLVRAVPAVAVNADAKQMVEALCEELQEYGTSSTIDRLRDGVLATVACHSAVRVGQSLDLASARALLKQVATVEFAASCPHGRPVAKSLTRRQVERMFGR